MIKARASGSKVCLYFMKKGRQARHRIPRNSCDLTLLHSKLFTILAILSAIGLKCYISGSGNVDFWGYSEMNLLFINNNIVCDPHDLKKMNKKMKIYL